MSAPTPSVPLPPLENMPRKSSRLWLFLPAGCLAFFAVIAFIIFAGVMFVMNMFRSSDVYAGAMAAAQAHPAVQEALGDPIKGGFLIAGSIHTDGSSGDASMAIPISGPEESATIHADATMREGEWSFTRLVVRIDATGERIDLLEDQPAPNDGAGNPGQISKPSAPLITNWTSTALTAPSPLMSAS